MRVFVGIEVSDDVRAQAEVVVNTLRRRLGARIDARWVPPENMHLTVRFIGHVADDRAETLLAALEQPLLTRPFAIELRGCGRFPSRGAPRVLWIGLTRGLPAVTELHQEFNQRLLPFGYQREDRPFSAHLTLARIKNAHARFIDDALARVRTHAIAQTVRRVTIFESRLSPSGARYSPLRQVALRPDSRS